MWEKIQDHVVAFVIGTMLLGGLLYATVTAYSSNTQVVLLKEEFSEYRESTNRSLEIIKEQLAVALLEKGKLSPEQIKDFITSYQIERAEFSAFETLDLSEEEKKKLKKELESHERWKREKPARPKAGEEE